MWLTTESGETIETEAPGSQPILLEAQVPQPLQTIIPSYLYQEYSDDANLQAFVTAYNAIAQSYLGWFNATPLGVYTSPAISGQLLDWVLNGLYGIARPVFTTSSSHFYGAVNTLPINASALNGNVFVSSGTAVVATDDYYKRLATWILYLGDGRHFNVQVLRKKVARFLFGANGGDVTASQSQKVNITASGAAFTITIPTSQAATYFSQAFAQNLLPFPLQLTATVVLV